jgi:hypothetical protein
LKADREAAEAAAEKDRLKEEQRVEAARHAARLQLYKDA